MLSSFFRDVVSHASSKTLSGILALTRMIPACALSSVAPCSERARRKLRALVGKLANFAARVPLVEMVDGAGHDAEAPRRVDERIARRTFSVWRAARPCPIEDDRLSIVCRRSSFSFSMSCARSRSPRSPALAGRPVQSCCVYRLQILLPADATGWTRNSPSGQVPTIAIRPERAELIEIEKNRSGRKKSITFVASWAWASRRPTCKGVLVSCALYTPSDAPCLARAHFITYAGLAPQIRELEHTSRAGAHIVFRHSPPSILWLALVSLNGSTPTSSLADQCRLIASIHSKVLLEACDYYVAKKRKTNIRVHPDRRRQRHRRKARELSKIARRLSPRSISFRTTPSEGLEWSRPSRARRKDSVDPARARRDRNCCAARKATTSAAACGQLRLQTKLAEGKVRLSV